MASVDSDSKTDSAKSAQELKLEGNEAFGQGDYSTAIDRFQRAFRLESDPIFLCNEAIAHLKLNNWQQARDAAAAALDLNPKLEKAYVRKLTALRELMKIEDKKKQPLTNLQQDMHETLSKFLGELPKSSQLKTIRETQASSLRLCSNCKTQQICRHCAGCKKAHYCSNWCQTTHWKVGGHKQKCKEWASMRTMDKTVSRQTMDDDDAFTVIKYIRRQLQDFAVHLSIALFRVFGHLRAAPKKEKGKRKNKNKKTHDDSKTNESSYSNLAVMIHMVWDRKRHHLVFRSARLAPKELMLGTPGEHDLPVQNYEEKPKELASDPNTYLIALRIFGGAGGSKTLAYALPVRTTPDVVQPYLDRCPGDPAQALEQLLGVMFRMSFVTRANPDMTDLRVTEAMKLAVPPPAPPLDQDLTKRDFFKSRFLNRRALLLVEALRMGSLLAVVKERQRSKLLTHRVWIECYYHEDLQRFMVAQVKTVSLYDIKKSPNGPELLPMVSGPAPPGYQGIRLGCIFTVLGWKMSGGGTFLIGEQMCGIPKHYEDAALLEPEGFTEEQHAQAVLLAINAINSGLTDDDFFSQQLRAIHFLSAPEVVMPIIPFDEK